jgi:hypothetical protein
LAPLNLLRNSYLSNRDFRDVVSQLVTVFEKPVCTSPAKGYFVARTERKNSRRSITSTRYCRDGWENSAAAGDR